MGTSTLSTRGRSGQGGSSVLLGDHIELLGMSAIDATGAAGGGEVHIGADPTVSLENQSLPGIVNLEFQSHVDSGATESVTGMASGLIRISASQHLYQGARLTGPRIEADTHNLLDMGQWDASAASNGSAQGGRITVHASGMIDQIQSASWTVDGTASAAAGTARLEAGESAYLSGSISAQGQQGGQIELTAPHLVLAGARLNANGSDGGGRIRVGGGWQGQSPDLANASETTVVSSTLQANALLSGNGGEVVVWSENQSQFGGLIEAHGGNASGNGGQAEVSSHGLLRYAGKVDVAAPNGTKGRLLLDPKNIEILATAPSGLTVISLAGPSTGGNYFGAQNQFNELVNNGVSLNRVYVKASDAVRLYDSTSGALIATVTGVSTSTSVTALKNGNFVISDVYWNAQKGAVTWVNGSTGALVGGAIGGVTSSSNSLVGVTDGDKIGLYVTALTNGNYVVASTEFDDVIRSRTDVGAVIWGNGTTGRAGQVDTTNSLHGDTSGSKIGWGGIVALTSGSYVVVSPEALGTYTGAITYVAGHYDQIADSSYFPDRRVSRINSFYGTGILGGGVGGPSFPVVPLSDGGYVVPSPLWKGPGCTSQCGAVTWFGSGGRTVLNELGAQANSSNSLIGDSAQGINNVGRGLYALANGSYLVGSDVGVVLVNGYSDSTGVLTAAKHLRGTGSQPGVQQLTDGSFTISLPTATVNGVSNAGKVIWVPASGYAGQDLDNIPGLYGTTANSYVGLGGVTALTGGNYVVSSPFWDNGALADAGAVTVVTNRTLSQAVSTSNSLYGTTANDRVGAGLNFDNAANTFGTPRQTVVNLGSGQFVVNSPRWGGYKGAVTWGDVNAPSSLTGPISSANSLVGSTTNGTNSASDMVGSGGVLALTNGNYLVLSPKWKNTFVSPNAEQAGAATWGTSGGLIGTVDATNSLLGTGAYDQVGIGGAVALKDGRAMVGSTFWAQKTPTAVYNLGRVDILEFSSGLSSATLGFSTTPSVDSQVAASDIVAMLDAGTGVTLQANNDIKVSVPVISNPSSINSGSLTLQAGRSVLLNANIGLKNANLTITGNDWVSNGVVNAQRDAGNAVITQAAGTSLNAGTGALTLRLRGNDTATKTYQNTGSITLRSVTGRDVSVLNQGATAGSSVTYENISVSRHLSLQANTAINLPAFTLTGNLSVNSGGSAITQSGALSVAGTTSLTAGAGSITLSNVGNDFTGAVNVVSANSLSLVDINNLSVTSSAALNLGGLGVGGNLSINSGNGNITQSGALTVAGTTSLASGTGSITLTHASNDFTGAVSMTSGSGLTLSDANSLSLGAISVAGPISVTAAGGDIQANGAVTGTQSGASLSLKATGSIQAGANITSNNGNIVLWSNMVGSANGGVTLADSLVLNSANGSTTATTGGGKIVIAGGLDDGANGGTASDGLPDGYTTGTISASNLSLYSGGGDIALRGSAATGAGMAWSGNTTIRSGNGRVVMRGESSDSHGIDLNGVNSSGVISIASSSNDASNPAIDIEGRTSSTTAATWGLGLFSAAGGAVQATGTAGIRLLGQTASGNFDYYSIGVDLLAASGGISVTADGSSRGLIFQGDLGREFGVTTSASNVSLVANKIDAVSQINIATSGQVTVAPLGNSFSNNLAWPLRNLANQPLLTLSSDVSGLTIGKSSNTSNITLTDALTVAGPVTIYGADITTGAVTATSATLTLQGAGNVTLGGDVTASNVRLLGGNVAFNGSSNTIGTLAASGLGSLSLVNSSALTVGTVGGTSGVSATGDVTIATKTGDLTVSQNIIAANLVLSADRGAAAGGAGSGGNVKLSGSSTVTASGLGKIFTGSVTGSAGVTTLIGSGSGRFRYNSDEDSAGYDTTNAALSSGLYAIYREQPTITLITAANVSAAYASTPNYSVTVSGGVNGDTGAQALSGVNYSAGDANSQRSPSNHLVVGSYTITAAAGSSLLGYAVTPSYATGTLTVTPKQLTVTGTTVASKDYDGTTNATLSGGGLVGVVGVDVVSLIHGGSFNSKHAAPSVNVTANHSLSGADTANYDLVQPTGLSATINPKAITASAAIGGTLTRAYDGTTSASGASVTGTVSGAIAGDTLAFVGNGYTLGYNDAHVANASSISASGSGAFAVSASTAGSLLTDYVLTQPTVAPVAATITPAALTATLANTGVTRGYNGNTDAPAGFVPSWSITGLVSGDTAASLLHTGAAYNTKDVLTANKVTVSGVSIGSITGNKGSQPSDYQVASSSDVAATITPKSVTLSGLTVDDKVYDGRTDVMNVTSWGVASTGVGSETLALTHNAASLGSANAGTQTVTVSSYALANGSNGALASNYVLTGGTTLTANIVIAKAPLTVQANNDAKFVTTSDVSGFAGVGYSGFVNGETVSVVSGSASVSRSNAGVDTAGSYSGVLVPDVSGLSATNYRFVPANGNFTIVPSDQLLVRVANASTSYGSAASYTISSAEYFNGSTPVALTNITALGNNRFTVNDLASGAATFTLAPVGAPTTGAGKSGVGLWQLATSGTVTENSLNFSDTITVVGSHQIGTKAVTASASNVSKVYDGNTSMSGVSVNLTGLETNDVVGTTGTGAFSGKNAGTGLNYSVSGLVMSGADASNYHLSGGTSFTGNNGVITAKVLTLTPQAATRDYTGGTSYTFNSADLAVLSQQLGVTGDSVTAGTAAFNDKNVATGKTLTATGVTINDGNNGGNYTVTLASNNTSAISRLNSVTWTGGNSGNWFDPANWAGGAVPDLANVANVVIPAGVNVSFDKSGATSPVDTSGVVSLDSLGTQGSLTQANGALNIGSGGMLLASYTQSGGTLTNAGTTTVTDFTQSGGSFTGTGAITVGMLTQTGGTLNAGGNLTVSDGFSQGSSGSISVTGNTRITDTSGGVQLGNISSTGSLTVTSTDGAITQAPGTSITASDTSSFTASTGSNPVVPADITLTNPGNDFVGAVSVSGANVALTDTNDLTLGNVSAGGDFVVSSGGDVIQDTTGGKKIVVGGNTDITAGGDITLDGPNDFKGTVNADGQNITLSDVNDITLGDVTAGDDFKVTAGGDITQDDTGGKKIVVGGNTDLTAGGDITLDGPNDFKGTVNADGQNITLSDVNDITLGDVTAGDDFKVTAGGDITQDDTGGKKIVVGGNTDLTAGGDITLDGPNDFKGTVNAGGQNITFNDVNSITLGDVTAGDDFKVTAGGDITQDDTGGKKIVVGGNTDLTAGGDITLDGPNDFKGTVNAKGENITFNDVNDITIGDVTAGDDFKITGGGDVIQDNTGGKKIVVRGKTDITAGGRVVLDGKDNQLIQGVTVKASSYLVAGDNRKSAAEAESKVMGAIAMALMPGVAMPNAQAPQPLVMSSAGSGSSSSGSATAGSPAGANSSGVTVDLQNTSQQDTPLMVAVSLPKGASTVGTGFSFEMPESVKGMTSAETEVSVTQTNGSPLPSWLKFDRQNMRFEASAVPDSALPMQLAAMVSGQRVMVVISERTE